MDLHERAERIRRINEANGFDQPTWDHLLRKLMLVVTELDEAVTATTTPGSDPLPEELADTAIRLLDILNGIWPNQWNDRRQSKPTPYRYEAIERQLWRPLHYVCLAAETWRYENRVDTRIALEMALSETFALAGSLGFDLMAEIDAKVERNAHRGFRHGKVRGDG